MSGGAGRRSVNAPLPDPLLAKGVYVTDGTHLYYVLGVVGITVHVEDCATDCVATFNANKFKRTMKMVVPEI